MTALWEYLDPPPGIAEEQRRWDRRTMVLRMRAVGMKFRDIAERLGVTLERARQIEQSARWDRKCGRGAPIVRWLSNEPSPAEWKRAAVSGRWPELEHWADGSADKREERRVRLERYKGIYEEFLGSPEYQRWLTSVGRSV